MRYYAAIVHKDANSAYGLSFPDLPGCFAAADDWDGIEAAATEALDLWFEDQPDATPAPLDMLRQRDDVAAQIAQGATLIPIPYPPANPGRSGDGTRAPTSL